jgi:hypothetical protein
MDSTYPKSAQAVLLPIFASLAIVLLIVPFIWHWRLRNIGACSLIFYISLANFFTFINVIIWPTENFDSWWNGVGLCDIEVKLKWPLVTGLACTTLCITRNLANVLDVDRAEVVPTRASKRRKVFIDLAICYTVPVLQIALHYIIQVNRYYIVAISGCKPSYDNSWPTIVIMFMWPLIFCLINCYYAGTSYPYPPLLIYPILKCHILTSRSCGNIPTSQIPLQLLRHPFLIIVQPHNRPLPPPLHHVIHPPHILRPSHHLLLLRRPKHRMAILRLEYNPRPKRLVAHPILPCAWSAHIRLLGHNRHGYLRLCILRNGR